MPDFEITVIGGGVVGLAVAARLSRNHPHLLLLERNEKYGMETSSRNSEVIHAGIYYTPGSHKARLCVEGRDLLYELCAKHRIAHARLTKLITATDERELHKLDAIEDNGRTNGVDLKRLNRQETLALEPHIRTAGSLFSPSTGIISAHELMDYFYGATLEQGGMVQHRANVLRITKQKGAYDVVVEEQGKEGSVTSEVVINAAGLASDVVAAAAGIDIDNAGYRLAFAKGSYFVVAPAKSKLVSRLIYPVPHDEGLGVHALLDGGGRLKFGPDIEYVDDPKDYSVAEVKRSAFGASVRRIVPGIMDDDLTPDMAGIRPKLQRKGEPPRDFVIAHEKERGLEGLVNLIGIDSPGLTASPAIARHVEGLLFG